MSEFIPCTSAAAFVRHVAVGDQLRPAVCHAALQSPFNTLICTRIGKGLCMFGEICVHVGHVYSRFTNHSHPLALCFPVFKYITVMIFRASATMPGSRTEGAVVVVLVALLARGCACLATWVTCAQHGCQVTHRARHLATLCVSINVCCQVVLGCRVPKCLTLISMSLG